MTPSLNAIGEALGTDSLEVPQYMVPGIN